MLDFLVNWFPFLSVMSAILIHQNIHICYWKQSGTHFRLFNFFFSCIFSIFSLPITCQVILFCLLDFILSFIFFPIFSVFLFMWESKGVNSLALTLHLSFFISESIISFVVYSLLWRPYVCSWFSFRSFFSSFYLFLPIHFDSYLIFLFF